MMRDCIQGMVARFKRRLRHTNGVIDLASIMVGVIIIGVISAGIVASTFTLIPFTQDRAAMQELDSVRTAEGAAFVQDDPNRYRDMEALVADGWIQASDSVAVGVDADGTCFAAMSLSATGNKYWSDSTTADAELYIAGTSTSDCVDLATLSAALGDGSAGPGASEPEIVLAANDGVVTTLAGSARGYNDGQGSAAMFTDPSGIAVDSNGNIYVADLNNHRIRKTDSTGLVSTFAGGSVGVNDGNGASAQFTAPEGVAVDNAGNIYVADTGNNSIRKITPGGDVTTLAGLSRASGWEDGVGSAARFNNPASVAVDNAGNVYVADQWNNTIRKITPGGSVSTLAGSPLDAPGLVNATGASARFDYPSGVAVNSEGTVYVADSNNMVIRAITPAGVVSTLAGSGVQGFADGAAADAAFFAPAGVAVDSAGAVYVADTFNHMVRKISTAGVVSSVAGTATGPGSGGFADGTGADARFNELKGVAVTATGTIYVADTVNDRIRTIR
jgi:sugar lactone lactonase YvrE